MQQKATVIPAQPAKDDPTIVMPANLMTKPYAAVRRELKPSTRQSKRNSKAKATTKSASSLIAFPANGCGLNAQHETCNE